MALEMRDKNSKPKPPKTKPAAVAGYVSAASNLVVLLIFGVMAVMMFSVYSSSDYVHYGPFGGFDSSAGILAFVCLGLIAVSTISQMYLNKVLSILGKRHEIPLLRYGGNLSFLAPIVWLLAIIIIASSLDSSNAPIFGFILILISFLLSAAGQILMGFGLLKIAKKNSFYFYEINILSTNSVLYLIRGFGGIIFGILPEIVSPLYLSLTGWMLWHWEDIKTE